MNSAKYPLAGEFYNDQNAARHISRISTSNIFSGTSCPADCHIHIAQGTDSKKWWAPEYGTNDLIAVTQLYAEADNELLPSSEISILDVFAFGLKRYTRSTVTYTLDPLYNWSTWSACVCGASILTTISALYSSSTGGGAGNGPFAFDVVSNGPYYVLFGTNRYFIQEAAWYSNTIVRVRFSVRGKEFVKVFTS